MADAEALTSGPSGPDGEESGVVLVTPGALALRRSSQPVIQGSRNGGNFGDSGS